MLTLTTPSAIDVEEYRALRATIRERGTLRLFVIALTFLLWAAGWLWAVGAATGNAPTTHAVSSVVTLLALAAGFEVVFASHVGVERIGRYLQARYETADGRGAQWEHLAWSFGHVPGPSSRIDPLATPLFAAAGLVNLAGAVSGSGAAALGVAALPPAFWVACLAHAAWVGRLYAARQFARGQRARDWAHFQRQLTTPESKDLVP